MANERPEQARIPSIDRVLGSDLGRELIERHGRALATDALRDACAQLRRASSNDKSLPSDTVQWVGERAKRVLEQWVAPSLTPVLNLTGTVLHTNLGRAPLPPAALDAMVAVAQGASNLEMNLSRGRRGDRDDHVEPWLCRLTGAEAATVVNNNAAAVLLTLNALALRREVPVSRGELIEIGGSFRIPDIMARAGCRLVEVGTTNRTHPSDYEQAISQRTAMLMKVHTSNYVVQGFTASVGEAELAAIGNAHGLPVVTDLGSGTLVDLSRYGLPHEQTPSEALAAGVDLVTFSADKLLGGPQCGIIVGRSDLVKRIKKNPMKRAMRVDKLTIAALEAVLPMFADPDSLPQRLPTLRLLTRSYGSIRAMAEALVAPLRTQLGDSAEVTVIDCASQIGSGALPVDRLASAGLEIKLPAGKGRALERLAAQFRSLPLPVVGRIEDGALRFDLRCLEDKADFLDQLTHLSPC